LGDATLPEGEEEAIARAVELRLRGEKTLFDPELSAEAAAWVSRIVQSQPQSPSRKKQTEANRFRPRFCSANGSRTLCL